MTMLEGLSQPQRDALNAIRAGGETTFKPNASTIKALIDRGLIEVAPVDQPQRWILSPVGEMMYFSDEVMSQYTTANFEVGQDVEYLHWHTNQFPMRFEWEAGYVQRITKAFVFVKYPNGEIKQHLPKRLRHKPMPTLGAVVAETLIEAASFNAFDVPGSVLVEASRMMAGPLTSLEANQVADVVEHAFATGQLSITYSNEQPTDTSFEPLNLEPRVVNDTMAAVTSFCSNCGCQFDYIWFKETPNLWEQASAHTLCHYCLWLTCCMCGKDLPANSHAIACDACKQQALDRDTLSKQEPLVTEPRFVAPGLIAVTAVCNLCGCQYDSVHSATLSNPWLFANQNPRCPACLWPDVEARKRERDQARLEHDEPLVREPRMVNDKLIAVTAFCKACGGQYDDISFFEVDNPWKRSQLVDYCPICLQFTCMWCGKELPAPAIDPYCAACNAGPMQVHKVEDALPASVCAEFSLLATFLDGGEGAYHALWTWYMQQISIGLIAYEGADPLQAKLYERVMRSASSLIHTRFEEEYFGLVVEVGTGRPEVDLLYHKLPISVETTVRDWLYTWGGFDYVAQMTDIRQVAREHAVYVDPIKPTLTAQEYREGQYGHRQRAGVCRVWYAHNRVNHLVEYVTSDNHVHLRGVETPIPATDTLDVEELEPVHVNDRVQRIDNALIGTVVGVSGGDIWVKPENGDQQPRWKRIHVDVIGGDPSDAPTDEYDRALNEAVLETMGGAHEDAPQPWTPDILKRVRIKIGLHAGVIGQVTDIGANARGATYKVFTEWYNVGDLEDPNTPMVDEDMVARNCAQIRRSLHGGMRVGLIESVTHVEDQYYRVVFTHFSNYVPDELFERVRFVYDAIRDGDPKTCAVTVDLAHPPFWRVRQSDEAHEFQAVLDAAGIALQARFNAQNELLVYHPLEDVLERLCANVRKLAGVLAVDLGFNDNPCLAQVKREAVRVG